MRARCNYGTEGANPVKVILQNGVHLAMSQESNAEFFIDVDVNGTQGPNKGGLDRFRFSFAGTFAPYAWTAAISASGLEGRDLLMAYCEADGMFCARLIRYDGWEIAPDYPR
jgi:hypothetical protein